MPVIIAIAAVSALAQAYQSEKARKASKERLAEIKAAFDALVPPQYNISPMATPEYIKDTIKEPNFDFSKVTPEQFKVIGQYAPQAAPLIAEKNPELLKETAVSTEGRQAMIDALRKMKGVAGSDYDPEFQQKQAEASARSRMEANSRSKSILQDAARRGNLDSGAQLMADLQGSSDSMQTAAMTSRAAATDAYRNKLAALRDSSTMGRDLRNDDLNMQKSNNDTINSFNERTSRNAQTWANDKSKMENDAQRYNLGEAQDVANKNVSTANDASKYNRERMDNMMKTLYEMRARERDSQNQIIANQSNWQKDERDRADKLTGKMYDDQFNKTAAVSGVGYKQNDAANQATADQNQMIQGAGNMGVNYLQYQQQRDDASASQDRADRRAYFEKNGYWPEDHPSGGSTSGDGGSGNFGSYA